MARPSIYSEELANEICERLANGESLRRICLADHMPDKANVFRWLRANEEFRDLYARAREAQADTLADEIVDIADDGSNDYMETEEGGERYNGDAIARSKLRVDARKWVAAKLKPRVYGDKLDLTTQGDKLTGEKSDVDLATRLAAMASSINRGPDASD
jgi:hypothetical protein